jgi:hypothetical protein
MEDKNIKKNNGLIAFSIWLIIDVMCGRETNIPLAKTPIDFEWGNDPYINEVQLASLIQPYRDYATGLLDEDIFISQLYQTAIWFRNEAMRHEDILMRTYSSKEISDAEKKSQDYNQKARELIAQKIGYVPDLIYSAFEQAFIRYSIFIHETNYPDQPLSDYTSTPLFKPIISRMHYRETFVKEGREAADKLPLIWFDKEEVKKMLHEMKSDYSRFHSPT